MALLLLASIAAAAEPFDRRYMISAARSVVRVEAGEGGPRYAVGTGTVIGPRQVVTAHHVVRGARHVYVISGGLRYRAAVRRTDPARDICVLEVSELQAQPLPVRPSAQLQIGEPVAAISYSGGAGLSFTTGEVIQLHRYSGGEVVETTAAFTSGASGGALLDSAGRLVGLLMFRGMNGARHFYAVPVEWLAGSQSPSAQDAPPFWQEAEPRLPYFMRAALLSGGARWGELESLAAQWCREEPDNAEPFYLRAQMEMRHGQPEAAARSYRQAIALDPRHALSWLGLTETMLQLASDDCARLAHSRLAELSPALSRQAALAHPRLNVPREGSECEPF